MSDLEFDDSFKQLVYLDVWLQRLLTKFDSWDMQAVKQFKQRASKLPGAMKNSLTPRKAEFAQQQAVEEFERRMYAYYLDQIVPDVHGMNKSARYLVLSKRLVQGVGRDKDINSELALTLRANRIGLPAGTIILSAVNRITKSPPQCRNLHSHLLSTIVRYHSSFGVKTANNADKSAAKAVLLKGVLIGNVSIMSE